MGWFDKKSWQLRGKIKDLQAELAVAEREGKYVVEQGLFFAELQDMGDATMMVLGAADTLDAEEESIIRGFFERNGFTVQTLRLDRTHKTLADVEIIPPEELTRHVARILKSSGYRMIDDSDSERPADMEAHVFPLSSVVRSIACLFSEYVHHLIVDTRIKMNMEGNRLLHWMPLIRDAIEKKVDSATIDVARAPFIDGYNHFYGRYGAIDASKVSGFERTERAAESTIIDGLPEGESFNSAGGDPSSVPSQQETTPPIVTASFISDGKDTAGSEGLIADDSTQDIRRSRDAALTLGRMYKALVGATPRRQVRNCELILEEIAKFFRATAACLLVPVDVTSSYEVQANAGRDVCFNDCDDDLLPVSQSLVEKCVSSRQVVSSTQEGNNAPSESMVFNSIESAASAPLFVDGELVGVIYVDRRENLMPFTIQDHKFLGQFCEVFREFPDLLLKGVRAGEDAAH